MTDLPRPPRRARARTALATVDAPDPVLQATILNSVTFALQMTGPGERSLEAYIDDLDPPEDADPVVDADYLVTQNTADPLSGDDPLDMFRD